MTWLTEKRHQNKVHISPMTLGLALMFPIKSGFRGWDSLLSVLTPIHSRQLLGEPVHYFLYIPLSHMTNIIIMIFPTF